MALVWQVGQCTVFWLSHRIRTYGHIHIPEASHACRFEIGYPVPAADRVQARSTACEPWDVEKAKKTACLAILTPVSTSGAGRSKPAHFDMITPYWRESPCRMRLNGVQNNQRDRRQLRSWAVHPGTFGTSAHHPSALRAGRLR